MQDASSTESRKTASTEARLDARLSPAVDIRLRMLALVKKQAVSRVLDSLLDEVLPPAGELAERLAATEPVSA